MTNDPPPQDPSPGDGLPPVRLPAEPVSPSEPVGGANPYQSPVEVTEAPVPQEPAVEADQRLRTILLILALVLLAPVALVVLLAVVCFGIIFSV